MYSGQPELPDRGRFTRLTRLLTYQAMAPRPVAVIGLGCIGGSLARALIAQEVEVRGWSASPSDREQAAAARVQVSSAEEGGAAAACAGAGIVVLAVPIHTVAEVA